MVNERPVQGRAQQGDKSTPKRGTPEKEPVQAPSGEKASVPSPTHQENSNRITSAASLCRIPHTFGFAACITIWLINLISVQVSQ